MALCHSRLQWRSFSGLARSRLAFWSFGGGYGLQDAETAYLHKLVGSSDVTDVVQLQELLAEAKLLLSSSDSSPSSRRRRSSSISGTDDKDSNDQVVSLSTNKFALSLAHKIDTILERLDKQVIASSDIASKVSSCSDKAVPSVEQFVSKVRELIRFNDSGCTTASSYPTFLAQASLASVLAGLGGAAVVFRKRFVYSSDDHATPVRPVGASPTRGGRQLGGASDRVAHRGQRLLGSVARVRPVPRDPESAAFDGHEAPTAL